MDDNLDCAADVEGAGGAIGDADYQAGACAGVGADQRVGGADVVARAVAGDRDAVTKSQAHGSW